MGYGQAGKVTEWWGQIKEDFQEESGRTYTGVQQKMEQLIRERLKELSKEHSGAKSGVAVRDDEFARILDDWIEIHEVHEAEMERKKKKLKKTRDETKDDKAIS